MPTADAEVTTMPPEPSPTEARLLDLLDRHLKSTERALSDLRASTERTTAELRDGMEHLAERIDKTSQRVFWLAIAILIVLAASSGASLYVDVRGATVATGQAASR